MVYLFGLFFSLSISLALIAGVESLGFYDDGKAKSGIPYEGKEAIGLSCSTN